MTESGWIEIRTENRRFEGERFGVLVVRDNGEGMGEATQRRAFEPFFTSKGDMGTGLGLATVRRVVTRNGGRVEFESSPGIGTTFRVLLPESSPTAEPQAAEGSGPLDSKAGSATHERVLFVEDEPAVRVTVERMLRSLGYEADTAPDAESALEGIRSGPRPDLLITDLSLPGISGAELARQAQQRWPEIRVLYTSGYTAEEVDLPSDEHGPIYSIDKPIQRERLAAALRLMEEGR